DDFLSRSIAFAPPLSIHLGMAGIAYAYYRIACARGDGELLARADLFSTRALAAPFDAEALPVEKTGITTPWHSRSGVWYVHALIAHARGDARTRAHAVREFTRVIAHDDGAHIDVVTGASGALLAAAALREIENDASLRAAGDALAARAFTNDAIGVAHGRAGMLYARMQWSGGTLIDESIASAAIPSGRGSRWPWHHGQSMPGWCNGSAGLVLYFARTGQNEFAEDAAWHAFDAADGNPSLCCGLTGRAYAMLEMHRLTDDERWLDRAHILAQRAVVNADRLERDSLFRGAAGLAVLLADLDSPRDARFPLFDHH
ncbi:MAG TPA: lanthionine synthetase LanC family protein, partial [Thermoanaerobaculia bacterium]|nr:lanthionine synthetase LanC family protein [Thermoanaerobaculia bacterium]